MTTLTKELMHGTSQNFTFVPWNKLMLIVYCSTSDAIFLMGYFYAHLFRTNNQLQQQQKNKIYLKSKNIHYLEISP